MYTRKLVGWSICETQRAETALDALRLALIRPTPGRWPGGRFFDNIGNPPGSAEIVHWSAPHTIAPPSTQDRFIG
jgi:transposase InsO family protein